MISAHNSQVSHKHLSHFYVFKQQTPLQTVAYKGESFSKPSPNYVNIGNLDLFLKSPLLFSFGNRDTEHFWSSKGHLSSVSLKGNVTNALPTF